MATIEFDAKKMKIFRMILDVNDENILTEIEELLYGINSSSNGTSSYYSSKILHEAVKHSEEDFLNGRMHSIEDVRKRFSIS